MTTIRNFERALGRAALWAAALRPGATRPMRRRPSYVRRAAHLPARPARGQRLLQPEKKALLFGYFPGPRTDAGRRPARRHGLHLPVARHRRPRDDARPARRHAPPLHRADATPTCSPSTRRSPTSSPCSSTSPSRRSCATRSPQTRGDLRRARTCSASWPTQFGQATGERGALRERASAQSTRDRRLGAARARPGASTSDDRAARPRRDPGRPPCSTRSSRSTRPAIADLLRIATGGTGVLPDGRAPPRPGQPPGRRGGQGRPPRAAACASAPSTTARRSTSPSASTCAP